VRVLQLHNRYQQPGGEDVVAQAERELLELHGHRVELLEVSNREIVSLYDKVRSAFTAVYSPAAKSRATAHLRSFEPHVVHVHNFFPLLSPSIYYACREAGVPVVQTLHNYRLVCPGALLMRDGRICEDCLGRMAPWPGVVHGCWRGSRTQTAVVATMLAAHHLLGTWTDKVDRYIALTKFARDKFIEGGLPAEKIVVKPNFVHPDPGAGEHTDGYALFVGRLSPEKGVRTLLSGWRKLTGIPLKIVGQGPLLNEVQRRSELEGLDVKVLGQRSRTEVFELMHEARVLIFPPGCYEGFPMTLIEAFACGLPVIASRLGAMAEIVEDGRTGLLFQAGNPEDLAEKVAWAWTHTKAVRAMGREARREYEKKYTAGANYEILLNIYRAVLSKSS
jgi:glycosyltransferase involved in cell wall biosynthesis